MAQNKYEFPAQQRQQLESFIHKYYQYLGISTIRKQLKHLQAVKYGVFNRARGGMYFDKLAMALSAQQYDEAMKNDNFLESR